MSYTLRDYIKDLGGIGVAGITVNLRAASGSGPPGTILNTTTTDAAGKWEFSPAPGNYDIEAIDGTTILWWKNDVSIPQHFNDAQIDAAADIALTKLDEGTGDDDINPATAPTNLDQRLNQILSLIKDVVGLTDWNTVPAEKVNAHHTNVTAGPHGIPVNLSPVCNSGVGYFIKSGIATVGAESVTPTTPVYYIASVAVTHGAPFPTGCVGVWVNSQWWSIAASAQGASASGFTAYLATQIAGQAAFQPVQWLALGH